MNRLDDLRVAVLAMDGFEWSELHEPVEALREAGARVEILAPKRGKIQGFEHFDKAGSAGVDATIDSASARDYDAVYLPGGALNADRLRMEESAREFVRTFCREGKPIAAICHAPWLLVSAGVLPGRRLTSYFTLQDDIRNAGGEWTDEQVVEDGNLVTSRQPQDLPAFIEAMFRVFSRALTRRAA